MLNIARIIITLTMVATIAYCGIKGMTKIIETSDRVVTIEQKNNHYDEILKGINHGK